jgi:hypothetical protein
MLVAIIGIDAHDRRPMAALRQKGRAWKFRGDQCDQRGGERGLEPVHLYVLYAKFDAGESNALIDAVYDPSLRRGLCVPDQPDQHRSEVPPAPAGVAFGPSQRAGFEQAAVAPDVGLRRTSAGRRFAGMINETADRIMMKHLLPANIATTHRSGSMEPATNWRSSSRSSSRPSAWAPSRSSSAMPRRRTASQTFARIMNLFVAVCMSAFLLRDALPRSVQVVHPEPGILARLRVVPILMLANVFLGIYYNQSVWYKLTTARAGGTIALIGAIITLVLLSGRPDHGLYGCRMGHLHLLFFSMAVISYVWGQKHYPVPYNVSRVLRGTWQPELEILTLSKVQFDQFIESDQFKCVSGATGSGCHVRIRTQPCPDTRRARPIDRTPARSTPSILFRGAVHAGGRHDHGLQ